MANMPKNAAKVANLVMDAVTALEDECFALEQKAVKALPKKDREVYAENQVRIKELKNSVRSYEAGIANAGRVTRKTKFLKTPAKKTAAKKAFVQPVDMPAGTFDGMTIRNAYASYIRVAGNKNYRLTDLAKVMQKAGLDKSASSITSTISKIRRES